MSGLRSYEGWWFVSDGTFSEDLVAPSKSVNSHNGLSISDEGCGSGSGTSPKLEASKEHWAPINVYDADRLEAAFQDRSLCDLPDAIVVKDDSGQRLSQVCVKSMSMKPVYWNGPARKVRRCLWMKMLHPSDDLPGGVPVLAEWDRILEAAYHPHLQWLQEESNPSDGNNQVVEKVIALEGPLKDYVLVLRQGQLACAKLTPKGRLGSSLPVFQLHDDTIRLVRGYMPYYITVNSAIKVAQADGQAFDHIALPNPFEEPSNEPPRAPSVLIFAVHGIGQKLAGRMGTVFIHDCERLREQTKTIINQKKGDLNDFLLLPITWRNNMYMGMKSYFADSEKENIEEESFESLLSMITLPNIPMIREVASDVGLDILLYMTPAYFQRIIKAALSEIRRVYEIFKKVAGEGVESCRVTLLGHSLGAAIVSDLVSFIMPTTDDGTQRTLSDEVQGVVNNLGFPVDCCFTLGSPLSMFFILKQLRPAGCVANIHDFKAADGPSDCERGVYPSLPHPPDDKEELCPRQVMFACRQFYNIFHPYDPIAYRMEPLIIPPNRISSYVMPVRLPYLKKGALHLKRQVEQQVQTIQQRANKAKEEFVASLPDWIKRRINSPPKDLPLTIEDKGQDLSNGKVTHVSDNHSPNGNTSDCMLYKFNNHGRIDFSLEESLLEHSYLAALRSHFSYWDDIDVASFVVHEVVRLNGLIIKDTPSPPHTPLI